MTGGANVSTCDMLVVWVAMTATRVDVISGQ